MYSKKMSNKFSINYELNSSSKIEEKVDDRRNIDTELELKYKNINKNSNAKNVISNIVLKIMVIIIVITTCIGVVMFILSLPGMTMEKMNEISLNNFGKTINNLYFSDTVNVDDKDTYEILNYLYQMGYDIKGFGFLTDTIENTEDGIVYYTDDDNKEKVKEAKSDFILIDLISDNYLYSISNYSSGSNDGKLGLKAVIEKIHGSDYVWNRISELIDNTTFGTGLLGVYYDDGTYGNKSSAYGMGPFSWSDINFDIEKDKLTIKRAWGDDNTTFKINGWTGKYGMPLELLIPLHLSTLMPDLTYDLITNNNTELVMLLHPSEEGSYFYESSGGLISEGEISSIAEGYTTNEEISPEYAGVILGAIGEAKAQTSTKYEPYISRIENHWYRDIYFVSNENSEFVMYDSDYEKEIRERRTMYETDKDGNYILYVLDDNGELKKDDNGNNIVYSKTVEDAVKEDIKVGKKAKSLKLGNDVETLNDLGWTDNLSSGIWSAYQSKDGLTSSTRKAFTDDGDDLHSRIYVSVYSGNKLDQKGEALRTETNPKTKKMFLNNKYLKYDGSAKTADVITELRKKQKLEKGAVVEDGVFQNDIVKDNYRNKIELSDGIEYSICDYVDGVSISQDLLTSMSMLENIHTLDSDYVARDLKELYLELSYYGKQNETPEERPRFLEWIIPQIARRDYPIRNLDKEENEYGTLLHAKTEYKAYSTLQNALELDEETARRIQEYKKNKDESKERREVLDSDLEVQGEKRKLMASGEGDLLALYKSIVSEDFEDAGWDDILPTVLNLCGKFNISSGFIENNCYHRNNKEEYENWVSSLGSPFTEYAGFEKRGDGSYDSFVDACKYVYGLMGIAGFSYCNGPTGRYRQMDFNLMDSFTSLPEQYNPASAYYGAGHHTSYLGRHSSTGPFDIRMYTYDFLTNCTITADSVYYKAGLIGGENQPTDTSAVESLIYDYGAEIIWEVKDLQVGDLIECYDSVPPYSDPETWDTWRHVFFVGEMTDDEIVFYTTGTDYTAGASFRRTLKRDAKREELYGAWVGLHVWDLDPNQKYEGYKGNEAVVSPVTGVLLEYGTYTDNEINSISNEEYRLNDDLYYNKNKTEKIDLGFGVQSIHDKVGYAKILVLDNENYLKLEKKLNNKWSNNSLFDERTRFSDDLKNINELEDWNIFDKTVYGYKEFAQDYDKYDVSGYVIYIDGFSCELPGKINKDGIVETKQDLSMDYFINNALKADSGEDYSNDIMSKYKEDGSYGSISEKIRNQINAESRVKYQAANMTYLDFETDDDILLIKEGTVIGRTYTNKEIYYMRENSTEEEANRFSEKIEFTNMNVPVLKDDESEVKTPLIQGNYIRIIMRDKNGEVVENVEDYIKMNERKKAVAAKVGSGLERLTRMTEGKEEMDGFGYREVVIDGEVYIDYQQAIGMNSSQLLSDGRSFAEGACGPTAFATALKKLGLKGGPLEVHRAGSYTTVDSHVAAVNKLKQQGDLPEDVKIRAFGENRLPQDKNAFYEMVKGVLLKGHIVVMDMREGSKLGNNFGNVYGTGDYNEKEGAKHAHWVPLIGYSTDSDLAFVANTCGESQWFSLKTMCDLTYEAYMGYPVGNPEYGSPYCDELGMVGTFVEVWK